MTEDQLPERVRAAEKRREFLNLLDQSSLGPLPDNPQRAMTQCVTCVADRCADAGCDRPPGGCACTCLPDKEAMAAKIREVVDDLNISYATDDLLEIVDVLYRDGWRRQ